MTFTRSRKNSIFQQIMQEVKDPMSSIVSCSSSSMDDMELCSAVTDDVDSVIDEEVSPQEKAKGKKQSKSANVNALEGLSQSELDEAFSDQWPTLIDKILSAPSDNVITVLTNLQPANATQSGKPTLLALLVAFCAAQLGIALDAKQLLDDLMDKPKRSVYLAQSADGAFALHSSSTDQLMYQSPDVLLALQKMVHMHFYAKLSIDDNQLLHLMAQNISATAPMQMQQIAQQLVNAIDQANSSSEKSEMFSVFELQ